VRSVARQEEPDLRAVVSMEDFRGALDRSEARLHYQPQVSLATAEVRGAEALLRWQHPRNGLLPPDDFLPELAHTPLMARITSWVVETACREAVGWEHAAVAVNIAASDAAGPAIVDTVCDALDATGLPSGRLTLEVTEHALLSDLAHATANLRALSDTGVRISLDDFGTGYSSMLYLRELPITEIKIDRLFTAGLGRNRDDDAIVAGLVKLAHTIGVEVVAEGVETEDQADALRELECDAAQGFLFGAPAAVFTPTTALPAGLVGRSSSGRRGRGGSRVATADATRIIRSLVTEGASLHTIAAALNRRGVLTAQGTRWVAATVGRAIAEM
jgi:EAL domain-containing protein (putative c-di-GMP-specific phosphodiesterase class I)